MEMRVQKFLAEAGIASRRAAEKMIEEGKVSVNGALITTQGLKIDPSVDVVEVDGKRVEIVTQLKYYMLHKPVLCVTTASDENGRKTVLEMLPSDVRVYPVGRLDYMSSGLLLLTNDGDLTYKLTHPKHEIDKRYEAVIKPPVSEEAIELLRNGVDLEIYETSPCQIKKISENERTQRYEVTLHEGKNRQIRRMFDHIGAKVIELQRLS
ncbi:MAG: rRNA pseudouridine synthase, partial [Vallitaleaceae bacterium]|nr:rRNA pseudouridine synthase [Vallitaleaceae bacterium]